MKKFNHKILDWGLQGRVLKIKAPKAKTTIMVYLDQDEPLTSEKNQVTHAMPITFSGAGGLEYGGTIYIFPKDNPTDSPLIVLRFNYNRNTGRTVRWDGSDGAVRRIKNHIGEITELSEFILSFKPQDKCILEFKIYWMKRYSYISMELTDAQILDFIRRGGQRIFKACDLASDYLLSQGLAEVQE